MSVLKDRIPVRFKGPLWAVDDSGWDADGLAMAIGWKNVHLRIETFVLLLWAAIGLIFFDARFQEGPERVLGWAMIGFVLMVLVSMISQTILWNWWKKNEKKLG